MEHIGGYAHKVTTSLSYDDAIEKVTGLLKDEGFGVLTEIDVKATLKKKLDLEYKPYMILGACNPPFAHRVLEAENLIGVLLPCNVVVWDEGDHRVVASMDARMMAKVLDNPEVIEVAGAVNERLERVLGKV
ncbi:MAG: hypothetical protein MAG453_00765 [Calditrichaeota bacterium]|nr:hypothetical protein [Calditrichota bacterium]